MVAGEPASLLHQERMLNFAYTAFAAMMMVDHDCNKVWADAGPCTALHCTALHCTALHCTALHCVAMHSTVAAVHHAAI